jgi:hypothetical protein
MIFDLILKCVISYYITTTKSSQEFLYTVNDEKLERVESIKDLSVIINYHICLSMYILQI